MELNKFIQYLKEKNAMPTNISEEEMLKLKAGIIFESKKGGEIYLVMDKSLKKCFQTAREISYYDSVTKKYEFKDEILKSDFIFPDLMDLVFFSEEEKMEPSAVLNMIIEIFINS